MFEALTYKEITIELLLIGFLTVSECINKRIEFEKEILKTIINN